MAHSCSGCAALQSAALPHQTLAYECWSDSQINSIALFCLVIMRRELSWRKECWPCDGVRNMNRHVYWKKCAFRKFPSIDKCVKATRNAFPQGIKVFFRPSTSHFHALLSRIMQTDSTYCPVTTADTWNRHFCRGKKKETSLQLWKCSFQNGQTQKAIFIKTWYCVFTKWDSCIPSGREAGRAGNSWLIANSPPCVHAEDGDPLSSWKSPVNESETK